MYRELIERVNQWQANPFYPIDAHTNIVHIADDLINDLLAEIERLEEELKAQKREAWNHEGVSKDYTLAMQKVKSQGEQIDALTRQRDMLAAGLREMLSDDCICQGMTTMCVEYMEGKARQALADAGMERPEKRAD